MKTLVKLIGAFVYAVFGLFVLLFGAMVVVVSFPIGFGVFLGAVVLYVLGVGTFILGTRRRI